MKIIKIKNHLTVVLSDGSVLTNNNCSDELYNNVFQNQDNEDTVTKLLAPELKKNLQVAAVAEKILNDFSKSKVLTVYGSSVYVKSVSELTVPEDLAIAIYKAESEGNKDLLDSYINFWTLCCLNKDSRARMNLFWFLNKYGMTISKSGLFIAYRNVEIKTEGTKIDSKQTDFISAEYIRVKTKLKKSPKNYTVGKDSEGNYFIYTDVNKIKDKDSSHIGNLADLYQDLSSAPKEEKTIYTDSYSRTFEIKIGEPVVMDRDKCDSKQDNTCSRGLHVAGRKWLESNYFGKVSLMVLVNPADVVAVPPKDDYGKMRTCAYYPVSVIQRDEKGVIIDTEIEDGFEDDFLSNINYSGDVSTEEATTYKIAIPDIPEINRKNIETRLKQMSKTLSKKLV